MSTDTPASRRKIDKAPLSTQIARSLREDIYLGRLKAGEHLAQEQLCIEFGTSRMPVRDALRELVYAGLLIQDDARHTVVAPLRESDLLDGFVIEAMLNGMGVRRAIENITPEQLQGLWDMHGQMLEATAQGDAQSMAAVNWKFHRTINRLAESPRLLTALRTVSLDVPRDFLVQLPTWNSRSNDEHEAILTAIEAKDADTADSLMTHHVADSGLGLVEHLRNSGMDLGSSDAAPAPTA